MLAGEVSTPVRACVRACVRALYELQVPTRIISFKRPYYMTRSFLNSVWKVREPSTRTSPKRKEKLPPEQVTYSVDVDKPGMRPQRLTCGGRSVDENRSSFLWHSGSTC